MVVKTSVKVGAVSKLKAPKSKKSSSKPSHPPTSVLVNGAIRALGERGGSSLQAIKKYIASNNKVDADKLAPFIKKYLKNAVAGGKLVQTKGKGASGSFKLAAVAKTPKPKKENKSSLAAKKPAAKKSAAKKKKPTGSNKKASPKVKTTKPAALKQKPTKQSKAVVKKTKTPKPKTATKKLVTAAKK